MSDGKNTTAVVGDLLKDQLAEAISNLPDKAEVPYEQTEEGGRMAEFRRVCPPQFLAKIDRTRLSKPESFDLVAQWDMSFPGPCASGGTGSCKTRAAWSALGRLFVKCSKSFVWFPVRRLITELERYDTMNSADTFFWNVSAYRAILIDDLDKVNWQFESRTELLFAFYDWVYRNKKACITTTNKDRKWWANKMGDAFTRRLFDEAHFEVKF